jgi:mono/diheme cytochrome c family protein
MVLLLLALLIGYAPAAGAAESVAAGRDIAERLCSRCHAVAGPGPSAVKEAPAFSGIGRRMKIDDLAEALAEGILTGHGPVEMPEMVLEPEEIESLLGYMHSIQE